MSTERPLAILSAMEEEIRDLVAALEPSHSADHAASSPKAGRPSTNTGHSSTSAGRRTYYTGRLWGTPVVLAFSRWGKVAAASTVTHVINHFDPREVIFSGVAGSLRPDVSVGDVVIADTVVQHDMDAAPLFPRFEIPLLAASHISADPGVTERLHRAAVSYLDEGLVGSIPEADRMTFGLTRPQARIGEIASGDRFIADSHEAQRLRQELPRALCVEMEGAAVGQVCHEHDVPFGVIRTISDDAGHSAHIDFPRFVGAVASAYTHGMLQRYCSPGR